MILLQNPLFILCSFQEATVVTYHMPGIVPSDLLDPHKNLVWQVLLLSPLVDDEIKAEKFTKLSELTQ